MNARAYLSAAGLVVLTMTLTFTGSENSAAQAKGGADRVMLEYRGGVNEPCPVASYPMTRVFPDGTNVAAFTVPPGMVLVVTDLEGIVRETVTWTAGRVAALTAFSTAGSSPRIRAYAPFRNIPPASSSPCWLQDRDRWSGLAVPSRAQR